MTSNHTTHHDDCGCKSAKYEATIAELIAALESLLNDGAANFGDFILREIEIQKAARAAIAKARGEA